MKRTAVSLFVALSLAGCASTQTSRAPVQAPAGFLQNYSVLTADPQDAGAKRYVAADLKPGQYRSIIVDNLTFLINTNQGYQPLDAARLHALSNYYMTQVTAMLKARHYKVVKTAGPGVARLRVAVVGLTQTEAQMNATDLIPAKMLFNVARMATDMSPYVLRVSIEGEMLDSTSGKLLGATIDGRESGSTVSGSNTPPSTDQMHELIDYWVKKLGERLDQAAGR